MLSKFRFLRAKCVREFLMRQYSKLTVVNVLILDFSFKELAKSIDSLQSSTLVWGILSLVFVSKVKTVFLT